jgi:hypothetical protein
MGAEVWSGIERIYYDVSMEKAKLFMNQIHIDSQQIAKASFRDLKQKST